MYVCICEAVTSGTILSLARDGVRTTRAIGEATGAGTVCGRCRPTIRKVVDSVPAAPAHRRWLGLRSERGTD